MHQKESVGHLYRLRLQVGRRGVIELLLKANADTNVENLFHCFTWEGEVRLGYYRSYLV